MIKKIFSWLVFLPFLFPIIYKIKIPLKNLGNLNFLDLVLLLIVFLGLILIFQKNLTLDFKNYLSETKFFKKLVLFLAFILFVSFFNFKNLSLRDWGILKSYFILPILTSIIIFYFIKKGWFKIQVFFYCYLVYASFLAFLVIVWKFLNLTTFDNRVGLFFDSPNQLAISLSLAIISIFTLNFKKHKKIYLLLIVLIFALFLTKSSGALFGILSISLLKNFFHFKENIFKGILVFSCFWLLCLFLINPSLKNLFYDYNPFENKNSFDSRVVISLVSTKIISENFWLGIGPANFQPTYLKKQVFFPPYPQWAVPHTHNLFSQIWISFGFWSLLLFLFLLNKKSHLKSDLYYLFLIYFLIHGLVDVPIWNNDQALFFWFIILF